LLVVFNGNAVRTVSFSANTPSLCPVLTVQSVAILIPYSVVFIGIFDYA